MNVLEKVVIVDDILAQSLRPIIPTMSARYSKVARNVLTHWNMSPTLFSGKGEPQPPYLPMGWTAQVQPEGQLYFHFESTAHFVTEAYIYSPGTLKQIIRWMLAIEDLARSMGTNLSPSIEIFLQLDEDDEDRCSYYLVDHSSCSVFWLHETSSETLGIPGSTSYSHLCWALNEQYWAHVEYFPSHLEGIRMGYARELMSILTHARADHLTSTVGTFPYTASQCTEFIDLLRGYISSSEIMNDKYIICVVARLWSQVSRHRFLNFYGEQNARLSRDQRVVEDEPTRPPFYLSLLSKGIFFNVPRSFSLDLEKLWIDNLVYAESWKTFIARSIQNWKEASLSCLVLIFIQVLFFVFHIGSRYVALISLCLSTIGFASGSTLQYYHHLPLTFETNDAAEFLSKTCHPVLGFTPLSLVYSLPKSLFFWSTGLLALQMGLMVFQITDLYVTMTIIGTILFIIFTLAALTLCGRNSEGTNRLSWWRRIFSQRNTENEFDDDACLP